MAERAVRHRLLRIFCFDRIDIGFAKVPMQADPGPGTPLADLILDQLHGRPGSTGCSC